MPEKNLTLKMCGLGKYGFAPDSPTWTSAWTGWRIITLKDHPEVPITMSFGAAFGTELVGNLIGTADGALYESKKVRNTFTVRNM